MKPLSLVRQFIWSAILAVIAFSGPVFAKTDPDDETTAAAVILPSTSGVNIPGVSQVLPKIVQPAGQNAQASGSTSSQGSSTSSKKTAESGSLALQPVPALTGPVIDNAHMLSAESKQVLTDKIMALYQQNIAQIAILTVPTTLPEDIFSYSARVFKEWKLGSKETDNGLLLVVAADDRKMQILTGYGLEGVLPDIRNKQIIREVITPYFKKADYGSGLEAGVNTIAGYLTDDPTLVAGQDATARQLKRNEGGNLGIFLLAGVGALIVGTLLKMFVGRFLGAGVASALGAGAAILMGVGVVSAALFSFFVFVLLMMGIGNVLQLLMSMRGGGFGGGGLGGGGFGGGGGGFGGGGASGSW